MDQLYDHANETNFGFLEAHEEMLSDTTRVDAYHRAIHRHVREGDVVLDLGTGTGLLACIASRAGASRVYAIEHSDLIDLAREIARVNDITNIEFVQTSSRDFVPPEPVDVVVHEQMGDELFNENMLANLLDARDRLLRPGGRILPARFRLFVEPVSIHDWARVRRFWNIELPDGIDLRPMEHSPVAARFLSGRHEQLWVRTGTVAATLDMPRPVLEFDLHTLASVDELATEFAIERTATTDTIVDGACVWFEACFDDELVLSTSPLGPNTSWGNRLFRLDQRVVAGETLRLRVQMGQLVDASTWTVTVC
ncbi:MAG: 50S ribosomal protein L11 methyltransferase [Ilumatobacteraceae bacterium]|nr:methyltransferase domain-containing protein [Acidimicrobiales bacterium]MCB9395650.1 methyltransferase domain-containing protein [Acidimicrobiaceae bacterium]